MAEHKIGRPRSEAAERAIVDAVLAELESVGYHGLTIEAVARRAGVGRPTVYRRWPDKEALVVGALIATVPALRAPSTDDPVADLRALATAFLSGIGSSPAARSVLAVHAAGAQRPELRATLREHYLTPRAEVLAGAVARAREGGGIGSETDDEEVRDLLFGPAIYRWLMLGEMPAGTELDRLLDRALATL